jgi:hypothetical protein
MCYTPNISLNFTVNETVTQISYVLDGKENVTVASNTILTNLPYGEHNVTVYATDIAGNVGSSETVIFTVAKPDPELEPFHYSRFCRARRVNRGRHSSRSTPHP